MLSIHKMSPGNAGDYYTNLGREDYYLSGGEPPGLWLGSGLAGVGLRPGQHVTKAALARVLGGQDPKSGQGLVMMAGAKHRPGWDLTFSAPKSVSVLWALTDNPGLRAALQEAQQRAARAGIAHLESQAWTRRGKAGAKRERPRGLIVATFEHGSSREQDPQLHTHCLVSNLCQREDGTWGGVETGDIYRHKMAAGAIYRAELARQLQELGFEVSRDGKSFSVTAIPAEIQEHFSQRRAQIEESLAAQGFEGGKASAVAALDTREAKEARSRAELFEEWGERALAQGFDLASGMPPRAAQNPEPMPAAEELLTKMTEHASTFTEPQVWAVVAQEAQGRASAGEIRQIATEIMQSPELVELRAANGEIRYSTREMIAIESSMAEAAVSRRGEARHAVPASAIEAAKASRTLSEEQEAAMLHILGPDGVACVQGAAGAGKSYMLGAAREAWELAGYEVRGAALAGKAAAGLEEGSKIKSQTLHSLLFEIGENPEIIGEKTVIVIDEAGMVGSRQMSALLGHAAQAGAKVVLVGDSRQLQPVDAGGAFRAIQARLGAAEMEEIRRQKHTWMVEAVHDFAAGRAGKALLAYKEHDMLHVMQSREMAMQRMTADWASAVTAGGGSPAEHLMLAGTRKEVRKINELAREQLGDRLGAAVAFTATSGKMEVREGERVLFTKNNKHLGVKNGQLGTVEFVTQAGKGGGPATLRVKMDDGRVIRVNDKDYQEIEYGYAVTTHKSQGVTVPHAYVLGGGTMVCRELAYVQMSRHKESCNIYLDGTMPEAEALATAELELGGLGGASGGGGGAGEHEQRGPKLREEATERMMAYVKKICKMKGLDIPKSTAFEDIRAWLNQNARALEPREDAPFMVGGGGGAAPTTTTAEGAEGAAVEPEQEPQEPEPPMPPEMRAILNDIKRMATARQADTTLDYERAEEEPAPAPRPEPEMEMEMLPRPGDLAARRKR